MINMRQQFVNTVTEIMKNDKRIIILLCDIGVHGFRQVFADHPKNIFNVGILEQSTISMAAGLAMTEFIPIVHTIAPFLVERSFEQLKDDFGYQRLNGNFVGVGSSYDYAGLGCTHHCPGDVGILKNIPNMSIVIPGTATEFDILFKEAYTKKHPTYYRLSEKSNKSDNPVVFGKACLIKTGTGAIVIAVGPILQAVIDATLDIDVTILYYTTIRPFDTNLLQSVVSSNNKIIICEPYYSGGITFEVAEALKLRKINIEHIGVPHKFLDKYGTLAENDKYLGLDVEGIKKKILTFIK